MVTQELIANMLGVRREGVTEAARKLQRLRVIEYSRGRILVLDRPQLEGLSCECYAQVRRETDRLLPALNPVPRTVIDGEPVRALFPERAAAAAQEREPAAWIGVARSRTPVAGQLRG